MASLNANPRTTEETKNLQLPKTPPKVLLRARSANSLSNSPPSSSHSRSHNHSTTTLVPSLTIPFSPHTSPASTTTFFTTFPSPTATTSEITAWLQTWFEINYSFLDPTSTPNITDYLTRLSLSIAELTSLSESELHQVLARNTSGLGANCVQALGRLAGDIVKAREITASSALNDKDKEKEKKEGEENNEEVRFFLSVIQKGQWGKVRGDKGWVNDSGQWGIEETFSEKIKNGIKEKVSGVTGKASGFREKMEGVLGMTGKGKMKKEPKGDVLGIEANRSAGVEREKNACSEGRGGWREEGW